MRIIAGVVSWNRREALRGLLLSLHRQTTPLDGILVVDNASDDGSAEMVYTEFPQAQIIRMRENVGCARARNILFREISSDAIVILDNDVELHERAVEAIAARFAKDEAHALGCITPAIYDYDTGEVDRTVCNFPARLLLSEFEIAWGGACGFAIRPSVFEDIGFGYNLTFSQLYGEEHDLCLRLHDVGRAVICLPEFKVFHKVRRHDAAKFTQRKRDYHLGCATLWAIWTYAPFPFVLSESVRYLAVACALSLHRRRFLTFIRMCVGAFGGMLKPLSRRRPVARKAFGRYKRLERATTTLSASEREQQSEMKRHLSG